MNESLPNFQRDAVHTSDVKGVCACTTLRDQDFLISLGRTTSPVHVHECIFCTLDTPTEPATSEILTLLPPVSLDYPLQEDLFHKTLRLWGGGVLVSFMDLTLDLLWIIFYILLVPFYSRIFKILVSHSYVFLALCRCYLPHI